MVWAPPASIHDKNDMFKKSEWFLINATCRATCFTTYSTNYHHSSGEFRSSWLIIQHLLDSDTVQLWDQLSSVTKWIFSNIDEAAIAIYYTSCDLFSGCSLRKTNSSWQGDTSKTKSQGVILSLNWMLHSLINRSWPGNKAWAQQIYLLKLWYMTKNLGNNPYSYKLHREHFKHPQFLLL